MQGIQSAPWSPVFSPDRRKRFVAAFSQRIG